MPIGAPALPTGKPRPLATTSTSPGTPSTAAAENDDLADRLTNLETLIAQLAAQQAN